VAYPKGAPRPAGAGRKKGTPNKATQSIREKLAAIGCDPIMGMAQIAMAKDERGAWCAPIELRFKILAELASYIEPKPKPIDKDGNSNEGITVIVRGIGDRT